MKWKCYIGQVYSRLINDDGPAQFLRFIKSIWNQKCIDVSKRLNISSTAMLAIAVASTFTFLLVLFSNICYWNDAPQITFSKNTCKNLVSNVVLHLIQFWFEFETLYTEDFLFKK